MEQQHTPGEVLLFSDGAQYAVNYEYVSLVSKNAYLDANNFRLNDMGNNKFALKKIAGEELKYPAVYNQCGGSGFQMPTNYKCVFAIKCKGYIFEIWCDFLSLLPTLFRLNGKIVAMSNAIPLSVNYGIQGHRDESCVGGEIYITDDHVPPQIYSVSDLLENSGINPDTGLPDVNFSCTHKYFSAYNFNFYSVNLEVPADHPVFIECLPASTPPAGATVIGSTALNASSVQYAIRYKDASGNPTGLSQPTPLIPIPQALGSDSGNYPFEKTYGNAPHTGAPPNTNIGAHIRFRITNLNNYASYELVRVKFEGGVILGALGTIESVFTENINQGDIFVKDIFDVGATGTSFTAADLVNSLSTIDHAKGIRYFGLQLYLGNITYTSRDLSDESQFINIPDTLYPAVMPMGKAGHKDMYNAAYYRSLKRGERAGWAVMYWGNSNQNSFCIPATGTSSQYPSLGSYNNFRNPNRRMKALSSADAIDQSGNNLPTAAADDNTIQKTFEVFELKNPTRKNDACSYKNIADLSTTIVDSNYPISSNGRLHKYGCPYPGPGATEYTGIGGTRTAVDYEPFHPVGPNDLNVAGDNYAVTVGAWKDDSTPLEFDPSHTSPDDYSPLGYGPSYYSLGMYFGGLAKIPTGVAAFSLVKTPDAGRVVVQGIGFYSLNGADYNLIDNAALATKNTTKLWAYLPDVENGIIDITELMTNASLYNVELVSPMGFFTEVLNFRSNDALLYPKRDYLIDMITYCRVLFEDGSINNGDNTGNIGVNGYVAFNKYRNSDAPKTFTPFPILGITVLADSTTTPHERQTIYEIEVSSDIFQHASTGGTGHREFDDTGMRNFHEPVYIINIIRANANIDTSVNQQQYLNTGHYQKIVSIIAKADGNANTYPLVDERWEDCVTKNATDNKYTWIDDGTGFEAPWIDITNKSGGDKTAILNDILHGTNTSGANPTGTLAGVYSHTIQQVNGFDRFYTLVFNTSNLIPGDTPPYEARYIPQSGYLVKVRYDNRFPCLVFGGNTFISENVCAVVDGKGAESIGDGPKKDNHFPLGIGMPYFQYLLNGRYYIFNRTQGVNRIQDKQNLYLAFIRQWLLMFACETRMHVGLAFNNAYPARFFPLVNYVIGPGNWDSGDSMDDNHVFTGSGQYVDNYPELSDNGTKTGKPINWEYGGFRFLQTTVNTNIDYSHEQDNFSNFSKPKVGFKEQNHFCSQVIFSSVRAINEQNDPGLKNFPATNFRNLDDAQGAITKLWDAYTDKGNNLYAIADSGICLILTNKFMARQQTGGALGIIDGEGVTNLMEEEWLSKEQGLPDEFWRAAAEYDNQLWFINPNSVWKFTNNILRDIGREYYHSRIYIDMISKINPGYSDDLMGHFDSYHGEYWVGRKLRGVIMNAGGTQTLSPGAAYDGVIYEIWSGTTVTVSDITDNTFYIQNRTGATITIVANGGPLFLASGQWGYYRLVGNIAVIQQISAGANVTFNYQPILFVYQDEGEKGRWLGTYDYAFDKYVEMKNVSYGMRTAQTFQLNKGLIINGANIIGSVLKSVSAAEEDSEASKEFWRMRFNTTNTPASKPTRIECYDTLDQVRAGQVQAFVDITTSPLYLKDYGKGWEQYVPVHIGSRLRFQGRTMIFKIIHSNPSDFYLLEMKIKTKNLV